VKKPTKTVFCVYKKREGNIRKREIPFTFTNHSFSRFLPDYATEVKYSVKYNRSEFYRKFWAEKVFFIEIRKIYENYLR
jgi:hypothetical protein